MREIASDDDDDNNDDGPRKKKLKSDGKSEEKNAGSKDVVMLTALKIKDHFRRVWEADQNVLQELYPSLKDIELKNPTDLFFLNVMPVPPTKFRPVGISIHVTDLDIQSCG